MMMCNNGATPSPGGWANCPRRGCPRSAGLAGHCRQAQAGGQGEGMGGPAEAAPGRARGRAMTAKPQLAQGERGLNPHQARFVEEYVVDLCGKQAAIRAGYSAKAAEVQAARMLRTVKVQRAVHAALEARSTRTELTQDYVIERLRCEATRTGPGSSHSARV